MKGDREEELAMKMRRSDRLHRGMLRRRWRGVGTVHSSHHAMCGAEVQGPLDEVIGEDTGLRPSRFLRDSGELGRKDYV